MAPIPKLIIKELSKNSQKKFKTFFMGSANPPMGT